MDKLQSLREERRVKWSTESKDLVRSIKTRTVIRPESMPVLTSWRRYSSADCVEKPLRQPDWKELRMFLDSKKLMSWLVIIESNTFARWDKLLIGLVSLGVDGLITLL